MNPANPSPEKIYRLMGSNAEALAAIESVVTAAQREIRIFDATPVTLRNRGFGSPVRIEILRALLLANRGHRLHIVLHDTKAIGLKVGQGLLETSAFYWDQNDATRKFSARYKERQGKMPNMMQASVYGAVTHYLKAVAAVGNDDTTQVMAKMKATPVNDFMTKNARIREDGQVMREVYVLQTKKPSESKGEWDLSKVVATIPANEAFLPPNKACPLVK